MGCRQSTDRGGRRRKHQKPTSIVDITQSMLQYAVGGGQQPSHEEQPQSAEPPELHDGAPVFVNSQAAAPPAFPEGTAVAGIPAAPTSAARESHFTRCPADAVEYRLISVYDGDTITVAPIGGGEYIRVRLLGIDTPELKAKEPFAEEARDLLRQLLGEKNDHVYVLVDPNEAKDHYGRTLGYVLSSDADGNGVTCANVSIVENGFARAYFPGDSRTETGVFGELEERLKRSQAQARGRRTGIWSLVDETAEVMMTRNGKAYHRRGCEHLRGGGSPHTTKEALDAGLTPCRSCKP